MTDDNPATAYLRTTAPYPTQLEDVTADRLVRALIVTVIAMDARMGESPQRDLGAAVVSTWSTVYLLRAAIAAGGDPRTADALARGIWLAWQAGDSIGTSVWEWATEYGLDADRLVMEAHQAARKPAAARAGGTPT